MDFEFSGKMGELFEPEFEGNPLGGACFKQHRASRSQALLVEPGLGTQPEDLPGIATKLARRNLELLRQGLGAEA